MPKTKSTSTGEQTAAPVDTKAARVTMLVPAHARENYAAMVAHHAAAAGVTVDEARAEQVRVWREQHTADAAQGFDVLADWLEDADLDDPALYSQRVDPEVEARVRAVQAAKADFNAPVDGLTEAEQAEVAAYRAAVKDRHTEQLPGAVDESESAE